MLILTANEQEIFDKLPLFDYRERKQFLSLPKGLMDIAATQRCRTENIQQAQQALRSPAVLADRTEPPAERLPPCRGMYTALTPKPEISRV